MMRFLILAMLLLARPLWAAPDFPELTGRVVDQAGLLTPAQVQSLSGALASAEQNTSNQVVVVTLTDLQGYDIADYGYQLGRHWGIGSKDNDNGVLLIVAPNDRKVRIEVGYGLEGALTDALSSIIIQQEILPAFRQGQFYGGIQAGVTAIQAAIKGEYAGTRQPGQKPSGLKALGILGVMIVLTFLLSFAESSFLFCGLLFPRCRPLWRRSHVKRLCASGSYTRRPCSLALSLLRYTLLTCCTHSPRKCCR